jgi:hypothetical protein
VRMPSRMESLRLVVWWWIAMSLSGPQNVMRIDAV